MNEQIQQDFIPFTSDYGFKVTFGNEKNTVFLKRALQALLKLPYAIQEIVFSKATFDGLIKDSRSGIFDMVCTDERGDTFIVEMQGQAKSFFLNRLQFYAFQRFDILVKKGKFDFDIKEKIYCIAIIGTNINDTPSYHNMLSLKNQDGVEFSNSIQYVTVELEKFTLKVEEVKTDLEKLIFTIKNAHIMTATAEKPTFWEEDWLNIPLGELDIRTMSPERYEAYQYWLVHQAEEERWKNERERAERELSDKQIEFSNREKELLNKERELLERTARIENSKIEGKIEIIKELLREGLLPLSSIAKVAHVSEEFVLNIKNEL
jgi:predicted transposase/invertase (TIGR01784 family)